MKKKFLGLAIVAMSLVAFNGMAQTPAGNSAPKQEKAEGKQAMKGKKGDRPAKMNPFEGLTLTDAQKAKLQELDAKRAAAKAEKSKELKADKQRRDEAKMADRRAAKKQYLEDVKAIIGPEQYVVFLENMVINGNAGKGKPGMHKDMKGMKDGKARADRRGGDRKGNRDNRGKQMSDRQGKTAGKAAKTNS